MANWKEVAFTDNVPNLGNNNLSSEASNRFFSLKQTDGSAASRAFTVLGARADDGQTSTALSIQASVFSSAEDGVGTPACLFTHSYAGHVMNFTSSAIMQFNSNSVWACAAPSPSFTCSKFQIYNESSGSAANPTLALTRRPPSGSNDYGEAEDNLGVIVFEGEDSGGVATTYASIESSIVDATNFTEDGRLDIRLMNAGTVASAVKILPRVLNTDVGKLDSLEVYGKTLKDLLTGFHKHTMKSTYKMYISPHYVKGFREGYGHVAALTPGLDAGTNTTYRIIPATIESFTSGSITLDGAQGAALSSFNDSDNVGYGDAWLTYEQFPGCPAMTVEISGHVWWKPAFDPPSGQSLSIWYAYEQIEGGLVADIDADTGIAFAFQSETSTMELSDGNEVTKLPFSFTQNISASTSETIEHMFLLGNEIKSAAGVTYLGQSSTSALTQRNNMVIDVTIRVYPQ